MGDSRFHLSIFCFGSLPYARRQINVIKNVLSASLSKTFATYIHNENVLNALLIHAFITIWACRNAVCFGIKYFMTERKTV